MAEGMTEQQVMFQERENTGTLWTRNKSFDKNGYLVVKDLWDPEELYHPLPELRGQLNYYDKDPTHFNHTPVENQVEGSVARYWHPQYRTIHSGVRKKLEKVLGRKLYNTYYYDRYYFPGQELTKHADRDACEISVSIHISTNLPDDLKDWEFKIKTPDTFTDKKKKDTSKYNFKIKSYFFYKRRNEKIWFLRISNTNFNFIKSRGSKRFFSAKQVKPW